MRDEITTEDRDRLFWKGLPKNIRQDVHVELLAKNSNMNRHKPPDMDDVHEIILSLLDKNSLYAGLTPSRTDPRSKRHRSGHKKKLPHSKPYDTSDDDDQSSSEEERPS